ncbi:hypothetical protein A2572_00360 [Candidatus Collierbacteria bacterium RIFOXYD1_FULL_40_9]|uniref:Pseudouridine synthase RsuA/RluA-like domain-containing protein n=1 Tax=Candidatus Collierbacteria bacterium RIFOXYD1_FULL_40_9 TaxID=1817731 RepID=A0A1F5FVA0_9BACT|nr:MAG: hypothetical protein A2572_00360 [Candidatus Collierbacteria bacterium RIFOXYD1_FULL_40_9]
MIEIPIVRETDDYIVINKPVGLVVNRAESIKGETVQDWVEKNQKIRTEKNQNNELFLSRSGICHRLDKETSGCLLIAKNPETLRYFLDLFKFRKIEKRYIALVHGAVEPEEGEVVLPLRRSLFEREKWHVHYDGKRAVSNWRVLSKYVFDSENERWKDRLSLLSVGLKTGRTHQIRVHFSFLGWPLFADDKYLQKKQAIVDRKSLNRHFLHAGYLAFIDNKGKNVVVESPLPEDCQGLLDSLDLAS